jgi:hypothetical protein
MPRGSYGKDTRLSSVVMMGSNPMRGTGRSRSNRQPILTWSNVRSVESTGCTTCVGLGEWQPALCAGMMELVDLAVSKTAVRKDVRVRVPLPAYLAP